MSEAEIKFKDIIKRAKKAKKKRITKISIWQKLIDGTDELPNRFANPAFHIIYNYMKEVFGNSFKGGLALCNAGLTILGKEFAKLGHQIMEKTCGEDVWNRKTLKSYSQSFELILIN